MNVHPDRRRRAGIPLVPDVDALIRSERQAFHRALAAHVFAHTHKESTPEQIIERTWPSDDRAMWLTRAAQSPTDTSSAAALAITRVRSLLLLAPGSAAAQLFARCMQLDLEGILQVAVPHVATHALPLFVQEGGPIPVVQPNVAKTIVGPARKLAFGVGLTRELDEATPETGSVILGRLLGESAAKSLNTYVFDNQPASTLRPAGLLNGVTPLVSTVAGSGISAAAGDISKIAGAMADSAINPANMILITHPVEAWNFLLLRGFERLVPLVLQSPAIPRGTVIGVAPEAIASAYSGDPEIEVSGNVGAAQFEDTTPASDLMTGSPVRSFWQTDTLACKVRVRCAWSALQPGCVQFLQSVNW